MSFVCGMLGNSCCAFNRLVVSDGKLSELRATFRKEVSGILAKLVREGTLRDAISLNLKFGSELTQ